MYNQSMYLPLNISIKLINNSIYPHKIAKIHKKSHPFRNGPSKILLYYFIFHHRLNFLNQYILYMYSLVFKLLVFSFLYLYSLAHYHIIKLSH